MKRNLILYLIALHAAILLPSQSAGEVMEPVHWQISLEPAGRAGEKILQFKATIDPGWHLYGLQLPQGGPIPTQVIYETLKGATLPDSIQALSPLHTRFDETFQMTLHWYEKEALFRQRVHLKDPAGFQLAGYIRYMACNDQSCLPPTTEAFHFQGESTISAAGSPSTPHPATDAASAPSTSLTIPIGATIQPNSSLVKSDLWTPVIEELNQWGKTEAAQPTSWWFLLLSGFIGGLLALLTPCVWPIIPLTVSFFINARDRARPFAKLSGTACPSSLFTSSSD
jgi:thiol:disulfide interchange protein DsbD